MAALRHLPLARRRALMLLALMALAARMLVPAGWMPVAGDGGVTIGLCAGDMGAGDMTAGDRHAGTAPMATMPMMPGATHHPGAPLHHQGAPDHPCTFAGVAAAADVPVLAPITLPSVAIGSDISLARAIVAAPGHGLAAPPPPSHAPPPLRA